MSGHHEKDCLKKHFSSSWFVMNVRTLRMFSVRIVSESVDVAKGDYLILNIIADENCFRLMWLMTC